MEEQDSITRKKNNDYACEMIYWKKCIHMGCSAQNKHRVFHAGWKQQHYLMLPLAIEKDEKF